MRIRVSRRYLDLGAMAGMRAHREVRVCMCVCVRCKSVYVCIMCLLCLGAEV
jgi:hypothetical protein